MINIIMPTINLRVPNKIRCLEMANQGKRRIKITPLLYDRPGFVNGLDVHIIQGNQRLKVQLTNSALENVKLFKAALGFFASRTRTKFSLKLPLYIDNAPRDITIEGKNFRYIGFKTEFTQTEKLSFEGRTIAEVSGPIQKP